MSEIRKIDDNIVEIWEKKETLDIADMDAEIKELQTQLDNFPTLSDEDLLAWAKASHPLFSMKTELERNISSKTTTAATIKADIGKVEDIKIK